MSFPQIGPLIISQPNQVVSVFNRLINQIGNLVNYMNGKPQLDSINLTNISLAAGNNQVSHTLGKVLTGWTLTDNTSAATIYRYAPSNNTTLFLNSSVAATISITVF